MTRFQKLLSLFGAAAVMLAATSASAQRTCTAEEPCVLRMATVAPPNTPWSAQMESLKERIESASNGRVDVNIFPGASDGENSLARQCKDGSLEAVGVSTGALSTLVPAMSVFELPFLFDSAEQADRIIDNHLFDDVEQLLADAGFQLYIFSENGYRNFATTNGTVIDEPSDLAGVQMRAQENWLHEAMYRSLGGNFTSIPVTEVGTALSTGRVQGFDNTVLFAMAAGWHNFIDTWTVSDHVYQPAVVVYNKEWYDSLPEDIQQLLISNRDSETQRGRRLIRQIAPALLQNLRNADIEVVELTDEQKQAFKDATEPVYQQFRQRVPEGVPLLDTIRAQQ
jgi:TRAP-type C4-dicarboxylate transport system substrate-binding protein